MVNYRTPSVGSIAGGTVLTISGGGFATDAYSTSNVVWLEGEDGVRVICDFIRSACETKLQHPPEMCPDRCPD